MPNWIKGSWNVNSNNVIHSKSLWTCTYGTSLVLIFCRLPEFLGARDMKNNQTTIIWLFIGMKFGKKLIADQIYCSCMNCIYEDGNLSLSISRAVNWTLEHKHGSWKIEMPWLYDRKVALESEIILNNSCKFKYL